MKNKTPKQSIKQGDFVQITAGKDRGKTGKVLKVLMEESKVIVEGVNMIKKHVKPSQGNAGQVVELSAPVHISNVMIYDKDSKQRTRVGRKDVDGQYVRFAKKTGNQI